MLKNYIIIAFRNLRKNPGYSFINITGLTIGLTCCLLIFQYVSFEYSFDDFNENAPNLYRIETTRVQQGGAANTIARTGYAIGPTLAREVPEVVRFTRLHPEYNEVVVSNPDQPENVFEEERVYYADPTFFEMFTYPLIEGQPGEVLSDVVMRGPEGESIRASNAVQYVNAQRLQNIHLGSIYAPGTISGSPRVVRFFTFIYIHFSDCPLPYTRCVTSDSYPLKGFI